jgi:hypothetical protein
MTEADFTGGAARVGRPPRERARPRLFDPAGTISVLKDLDVAKFLTTEFLTDGGIHRKEALRYNAFVALMSFCHVSPGIACQIPIGWWLPDGLDAVRVKRQGEVQNIPVCEGAYAIVDRYLDEGRRRPPDCVCPKDERCVCGMMFTSINGRPMSADHAVAGLCHIGIAIGARFPVTDMLLRFGQRKLEEAGDGDIVRRFLGYRTKRGPLALPLPEIAFDDLADLGHKAGRWYAPYGRRIGNKHRAAELLVQPAAVPARYPGRRGPPTKVPVRLPADHPLVAEILAIQPPEGERELARHRRWRRVTYFLRLEELRRAGDMDVEQASELLLIEPTAYWARRRYHLGGGKKRKAAARPRWTPVCRPRQRVRPDKTQVAVLDLLRRFAWSKDPAERSDQRRGLVPVHFVALDAMVWHRVVKITTARRLLDLDKVSWRLLRTAVAVGFSLDRVLPTQTSRHSPMLADWRRRVEEAHATRAPGEIDAVVYFRLREKGFEGSYLNFADTCSDLRGVAAAIDEAEPPLVALLREFVWPASEAGAAAESTRLLAKHLVEVAGLVEAGRAQVPSLAAFFHVKKDRFTFLLSALRAGLSVEQAMRPAEGRPLPTEDWRIADEIVRASGYGEKPRTLYFRAVLAGFSGSEDQFGKGTARLREAYAKVVS